jgi:endonuclease/exonuclease/phosphatase (EEP) superfamily protein YafD
LPWWITVVLWWVVGILAVTAAMRIFAWDDVEVFAVVNTVTAFVYLPAWIVVVVAAVGRRYALAAAALVIVVLQVLFMLPELTAAEPLPSWVHGAPTIRLLDGNVYNQNPSLAGYGRQIEESHPTLVTMEEAVPNDVAGLEGSGALDGLPYRIQVERYDPRAFLVASKYPLVGTHIVSFDYQPLIVETDIDLPSGRQALWVVHTNPPIPFFYSGWETQMEFINRQIRARGTAGLIVVGDFNSTWGNKGFRTILDAGMTDGAAARGQAFDMTWSQLVRPLPPFVRIDHLLTGSGVAVTQIETGPGPGSDHRDLHATIAIRR